MPPAKRVFAVLCAVVVLSSEFTGSAALLWFGRHYLRILAVELREADLLAIPIFLSVWTISMLCCLPSTPLWLLGGFVWSSELWRGLGLNIAGCWLGTVICFCLARAVRQYGTQHCSCCNAMSQPQIITTLLKIMEENQYKATIISRLAYAPMAVKNYGFGALTPVRTVCFVCCALIGDLPNTVLFTHLGATASSIVEAVEGDESMGPAAKLVLFINLAVLVSAVSIFAWAARREIAKQNTQSDGGDTAQTLRHTLGETLIAQTL